MEILSVILNNYVDMAIDVEVNGVAGKMEFYIGELLTLTCRNDIPI